MKKILFAMGFLSAMSLAGVAADTKPIWALLISGGCCHDYKNQALIISNGVSSRANIEWTCVQEGGDGTKRKNVENSIYNKPDYAKGYDIIVHNECFADDTDKEFIEKVLAPHRAGIPGVVLHCTMHTFRALKTDEFREFLGVTSPGHGPQHPCDVKNLKPEHPVMKGFPPVWVTGNEELYAIRKYSTNTVTVLATAADKKKDASGAWVNTPREHAIIWLNTYGKGRVFGTTLAHANTTMADPIFMDLLTRGMLWACDKLDENGFPKPGYEAPHK